MKLNTLNAVLFILISNISFSFATTTPANVPNIPDPVLVGEVSISDIEHYKWYEENFKTYQPDQDILQSIATKIANQGIRIEVYFGTWCPDSQREVPRLIKLLKQLEFDMDKLTLTALDKDKIVPELSKKDAEKLNIKMIPTFVFYHKNKEINRFVEFARKTLEHDVLSILSNVGYKHSYK